MKFYRLWCLIIFLVSSLSATADTFTLRGRVVAVVDGDTLTVVSDSNAQFKVRLMGIDAPEKRQDFGRRSKEALASLVFGKFVIVEYSKQDRYGRLVGKVMVGDVDANLSQIQKGLAWHYKKYQVEQSLNDRQIYAQAEEQARKDRLGLWAGNSPIPPWDWRRMSKPRA